MARRLHREIVDELLARIVDGDYAAGAMLPKEELVKTQFKVSRGTGREALRALEERRVVVVKHGRGATVRPAEEWNVLDAVVAQALAAGRRRRRFFGEVAELQAVLEPLVAGLAAERASDRQRAALRAAAERLGGGGEGGDPAGEIRGLIAAAAGNRPLASTLRALADVVSPDVAAIDHAALAEAVAEGDADAARGLSRPPAPR